MILTMCSDGDAVWNGANSLEVAQNSILHTTKRGNLIWNRNKKFQNGWDLDDKSSKEWLWKRKLEDVKLESEWWKINFRQKEFEIESSIVGVGRWKLEDKISQVRVSKWKFEIWTLFPDSDEIGKFDLKFPRLESQNYCRCHNKTDRFFGVHFFWPPGPISCTGHQFLTQVLYKSVWEDPGTLLATLPRIRSIDCIDDTFR